MLNVCLIRARSAEHNAFGLQLARSGLLLRIIQNCTIRHSQKISKFVILLQASERISEQEKIGEETEPKKMK